MSNEFESRKGQGSQNHAVNIILEVNCFLSFIALLLLFLRVL